MNYIVIDAKLKALAQICVNSRSFNKLSHAIQKLTSILLNSFGKRLGIRPRDTEQETMFEYMIMVNTIFQENLNISIFQQSIINIVKEFELLHAREQDNIPLIYIKSLIICYYELRKMKIPDLSQKITKEFIYSAPNSMLNPFMLNHHTYRHEHSILNSFLLRKIHEQQLLLQKALNKEYSSSKLENAIYLKNLKETLELHKKRRFMVNGRLKDNLIYRYHRNAIVGHLIIGLIAALVGFGLCVSVELIYHPALMSGLSPLMLCCFICGFILFLMYNKLLKNGGGQL